ncbi:MAG: toll/interleukin-1 receptor domain-containing protein [Pseudomonadota bacterium]
MRGFLTYSRQNDQIRPGQQKGEVTLFREALASALGQVEGDDVTIFQDTSNIGTSQAWEQNILSELEQAAFSVAILSQSLMRSEWCCREVEIAMARPIPVFPVYWIDARFFDEPDRISMIREAPHRVRIAAFQDRLAALQWVDRRHLKNLPYDDQAVLDFNDSLAREISDQLAGM